MKSTLPPQRRCRRQCGFTLVEVLVALSIVAIALMAGLQATTALTRNALRQSDIVLAQLCAENELVYARLSRQMPSVGDSQGNLEANDNDVARLSAGMQMELDYWEATLAGYDSYISLLRSDQQRLALLALNGNQSDVWGTVTQGAVLKGALEAAESRDR